MPDQPKTYTVDLRDAVDPIDTSKNQLANDVRQLFPDSDTHAQTATIRRAPIYNVATDQVTQTPELGTTQVPDQRDGQPREGHKLDQPGNINPADLDLSDPSVEADLIGDTLTPQPSASPETNNEDQTAPIPGYEEFAKQFEQYMGVPLQVAQQTVQQLAEFRQQVEYNRQIDTLAQSWGVTQEETNARLAEVRERYSKLNPVTQETLARDPIHSAQLIYAKLEAERQAKAAGVPTLDRSGTRRPPTMPKGSFTKAQIAAMSEQEYEANQDAIMVAYAKGLVV